ncbi:MAG: hypothetical protein GY868_12750, partial [Deltaproteobacteria bacterium]|nr:hypothetical protein [Deltaproteobacteria bacterium]
RFAVAVSDRGATGGSGFGAVLGSKKLKAIVVRGDGRVAVARPHQLRATNMHIRSLIGDKFLLDPSIEGIDLVRRSSCAGCPAGCPRGLYKHESGREEYLKNCQSSYVYYVLDRLYHDGSPSTNPFLVTSLCNRYGLCTQELSNVLRLITRCAAEGVLAEDQAGLRLAEFGSLAFAEALIGSMVRRDGIGDLLAEGAARAAAGLGPQAEELARGIVTRSGFHAHEYNPRYFLTNAALYATESTSPLNQLHEVIFPMMRWVMWYASDGSMSRGSTEAMRTMAQKFWGRADAADFSTAVGKGEVAKLIQDRNFAKENLVACDFLYPMMTAEGSETYVGDPELEHRLLAAVTGIDLSETEYYRTGETAFNLQRAIQCCEGRRGRADDTINEINFTEGIETDEGFFGVWNPEFMLPGSGDEPISRKGAVVGREEFSAMMDEYYACRGWDAATGLQTSAGLRALGLTDVVSALEKQDLVV